jgi:hypothetical protein
MQQTRKRGEVERSTSNSRSARARITALDLGGTRQVLELGSGEGLGLRAVELGLVDRAGIQQLLGRAIWSAGLVASLLVATVRT